MRILSKHWAATGVSVAGASHVARSKTCEDACAGLALSGNILLLAVGDGAGSAKCAAEGSKHSVHEALRFLATQLDGSEPADGQDWRNLLLATLIQARAALAALSESTAGSCVRDFATTLMVAVLTETTLASLQVGDGAMVVRTVNGATEVIAAGPTSDFANETTFINSAAALAEVAISTRPINEVQGLALVTDGVESISIDYRTNSAHPPFWDAIFEFGGQEEAKAEDLAATLSEDWVNELTDDDKTLVVAVRLSQEGEK
jgi:serine/threonine protein phosphatase PrpC